MEKLLGLFDDPLARKWFYVLLWLAIVYVGIKISQKGLSKYVKNNSTRYAARKIISFFGYLVFATMAMVTFNYQLSSLTLALGVAGAGIAFALQEVIVSVAGFLAVLFGNFYKVGDRVQLGGIKGDVVDIGVLRTTLMEMGDWVNGDLYNGKMVRVANSFIFKEPVYNYSGDFPFLWDELKVPLKHHTDVEWTKAAMLEIMNEELGAFTNDCKASWEKLTTDLYIENARIEPMVTLVFDENWITFTMRYVVDYKRRRATKDVLSVRLLALAKANKDKLEIASAAMEIKQIN